MKSDNRRRLSCPRGTPATALLMCIAGALTAHSTADPRHAAPSAANLPDSVNKAGSINSATSAAVAGEPDSITEASVSVAGHAIRYRAIAGTLTVGSTNELDALLGTDGHWMRNSGTGIPAADDPENAPATARMFYVAYFRAGAAPGPRPIIFLYNGGPSVASLWLHMGAFGPRRISIPDTQHPSGGPYSLVENAYSLLDVADLVFIDAPGTGFSRIMGRNAERAFWGVDQDAHAFERFIHRFLTKYDLWNNPKYLFGESYGTPRTAVLAAILREVDLNGIILLSQILTMDNSIDAVKGNPGVDQGYALVLPSYAATAFYHHKLAPQPAALQPFLAEVENYALGEYMSALLQGSQLPDARRQAVAEQLHAYTGLPTELLVRYNLRVNVGVFCKSLLRDAGLEIGRLDTRYTGLNLNPGSEEADATLDPMSLATGPAYYAAVNKYLFEDLKYGTNDSYKFSIYDIPGFHWDWRHQGPGSPGPLFAYTGTNLGLDLAYAMKRNPKMKILLAGGYFDLGTPFFSGIYEMHHLPIPQPLQSNIRYKYYETGHMLYLNEGALRQFHADVAAFVHETEVGK
jgi:carboxypeptidase C (cathepsin A)